MPAVKLRVDELIDRSGTDLGHSDWMTIDQDRIDSFAQATDDWQWIHVDRNRAASGPFGRTIAHGYLTLALVPRLLGELLTIDDEARGTNYGIDHLRFPGPVPVESRIRLTARLSAATRRADGGVQYTLSAQIDVEGQDRPALVAALVYLTYSGEA